MVGFGFKREIFWKSDLATLQNQLETCAKFFTTVCLQHDFITSVLIQNQRTSGPVNAHLISWPSKAQNIQNLENIW